MPVKRMTVFQFNQHKQSQPSDCYESPWPDGQPSRIGVISNPLSGGNQNGLGPIHQVIRRHPEVAHLEARTPEEVFSVLKSFASDNVDLIAVNGGDGTIQAVLTGLFGSRPFRSMPALALLYGGTSNMLPKDFGLKGPQHIVLSKLLHRAKGAPPPVSVVSRPILKIEASGLKPLYGMFFGAACIYKGIQFFHSKVHTLGFSGELAHGIVVARFLGALLSRKSALVAPENIRVQLDRDKVDQLPEEYLVFLVSSLEKLILGLRPYWGRGPGPLHLTAVAARPQNFLKALSGFFRGNLNRYVTAKNGYHSHEIEKVQLMLRGGFTLDGELYQTGAPDYSINITNGGYAQFVCQNG